MNLSKETQYERVIDKNKTKLLEEYIDQNYSLVTLIEDKSMGQISGRSMACPFHDDISPSMFVDENNGMWKCHSCGRGGRYISLYQHWNNIMEGRKWNYYDAMNRILTEDDKAKVILGFINIYEEKKAKLDVEDMKEFNLKVTRKRYKPKIVEVVTMESICDELCKKYGKDAMLDALAQMQREKKPQSIWNTYKNGVVERSEMSLEEMMHSYLD